MGVALSTNVFLYLTCDQIVRDGKLTLEILKHILI
jgi:hypothetical protein